MREPSRKSTESRRVGLAKPRSVSQQPTYSYFVTFTAPLRPGNVLRQRTLRAHGPSLKHVAERVEQHVFWPEFLKVTK
jgi:hypothetical protein